LLPGARMGDARSSERCDEIAGTEGLGSDGLSSRQSVAP